MHRTSNKTNNGGPMPGMGPRVKKIMERHNIKQVALLRALQQRGVRTRKGNVFSSRTSIANILESDEIPQYQLIAIAKILREDFEIPGVSWQYLYGGSDAPALTLSDEAELLDRIMDGIVQIAEEDGYTVSRKKLPVLYMTALRRFEKEGEFSIDILRELVWLASQE